MLRTGDRAAGRLRIATEGNGGWDGQPSRGEGVHHRWERALPAAGSGSIARAAESSSRQRRAFLEQLVEDFDEIFARGRVTVLECTAQQAWRVSSLMNAPLTPAERSTRAS